MSIRINLVQDPNTRRGDQTYGSKDELLYLTCWCIECAGEDDPLLTQERVVDDHDVLVVLHEELHKGRGFDAIRRCCQRHIYFFSVDRAPGVKLVAVQVEANLPLQKVFKRRWLELFIQIIVEVLDDMSEVGQILLQGQFYFELIVYIIQLVI